MYRRLNIVIKEIRLLGPRATIGRLIFESKRRFGFNKIYMRPKKFCSVSYKNNCTGKIAATADYLGCWRDHKNDLGFPDHLKAREFIRALLTREQQKVLLDKSKKIKSGSFFEFGSRWVDHGSVDWFRHPIEGMRWPKEHSSTLLLRLAEFGDIKLVWELGRFTWILDLIRSWLVSDDKSDIDSLFGFLDDFMSHNPLYIGPHWTSEQEVAIRALMVIFAQEVLRDHPTLNEERLLSLHTFLELHGIYLSQNLGYAERSIRNNHLIYGALGLFVIARALPWHKHANQWRQRSQPLLVEAAKEQWFSDGGYVQPSHNYHRSAWHGMLWARMVASKSGDTELVECIDYNVKKSAALLLNQMNPSDGRLPNWGPNDGALIGAWTECDYSDFRPLVQTLHILGEGKRVFESGYWDEEAFWLLGDSELMYESKEYDRHRYVHFDRQGLAVIRRCEGTFAVMRSGQYLSRYGQQADQLHVDVWANGKNLAIDAGSFNYNRDAYVHNWFRGSLSHNTVIVNEADQMIPHRTFKYLNWSKGFCKELCLDGGNTAVVGVHQGYRRLPGQWCHARLMGYFDDALVVADRLWPLVPTTPLVQLRLHWQFDLDVKYLSKTLGSIILTSQSHELVLLCSDSSANFATLKGSVDPFDGWISRYYDHKTPVVALNYSTESVGETWFLTAIGSSGSRPEVSLQDGYIEIDHLNKLKLQEIRKVSDQMIAEIAQ